MKIKVKQCCHSAKLTSRFEAGADDIVLLSNDDGSYCQAAIRLVKSADTLVVILLKGENEIEQEISVDKIVALMLGD